MKVWLRLAAVVALLLATGGCNSAAPARTTPPDAALSIAASADPASQMVIAEFQRRIPELMREQDIPGLAVAVVDTDHLLWAQGFGNGNRNGGTPVDLHTIFSVQSMSKTFTATAVMVAVQEGKVALDEPITSYLPDFTVHSAFEEHPERKMTLRMLLGHTAGFTHEAPVGNNDEIDPGTWNEHVESISDTWLRFPVGEGYGYSNLGIDLAAHILETVYGKSFATVMQQKVLDPIGMADSSFDPARFEAAPNRAIGYTGLGVASPLAAVPMMGAGGLYTSAADLGRFLSFQLSGGSIDGRTVLTSALMEEMRTVPAPNAGAGMGYALGVTRMRWRAENYQDIFNHGGGGFGFLSDLWWVPSLQIGIAILTNSSEHNLQDDLAISILRSFVDTPGTVYGQRLVAQQPQENVADIDTSYQAPPGMDDLLSSLEMAPTPDRSERWARYEGLYSIEGMGLINPIRSLNRFSVEDGVPYFYAAPDKGPAVRHRLVEYQAGLFVADNGETLDFRGATPTWRNVELIDAMGGPLPWQWALIGLAALASLAWFVLSAWSFVRRRRLAVSESTPPMVGRLMLVLGSAAALLALGTVGMLAVLPGLVDSGFIGWLQVPILLRLAFHMPFLLTALAAGMVVVAAVAIRRGWGAREFRVRFALLAAATATFSLQLLAWGLVGVSLA